jgi:hypothetical protein
VPALEFHGGFTDGSVNSTGPTTEQRTFLLTLTDDDNPTLLRLDFALPTGSEITPLGNYAPGSQVSVEVPKERFDAVVVPGQTLQLQFSAWDGFNRSDWLSFNYYINLPATIIVNSTGPLAFQASALGNALELNLTIIDDEGGSSYQLKVKFDTQTAWTSWSSAWRGFGTYSLDRSRFVPFLSEGQHSLCILVWDGIEDGPPLCLNYTVLPSATLLPLQTRTQLTNDPAADTKTNDDAQEGGPLGTGVIAGIAVGAAVVLILVGAAVFCIWKRPLKKREDTASSTLV